MEIYLVRHAAAYGRDPERWPDDSQRPLTPEGEEEFRLATRGLAAGLVQRMDAILTSPYERAWQTAEILSEVDSSWPSPKPLAVLEPTLPPEKAALALEDHEGSVAIVGHRPGLHELAAYLLTGEGGGMEVEIEKGGVACIRFAGPAKPGAGELRWLLTPEALRLIALD